MIIFDVLRYCYERLHSPQSGSSLLMPALAENNGGACAQRQSVKKHNKSSFRKM